MLKEEKFYELCTSGGLDEINAYAKAYQTKDRKTCLTSLASKKKRSPELFEKIADYKAQLFDKVKKAQHDAASEFAKDAVLSSLDKRQFLKQMISGTLIMEEVLISGTKTKKIKRKPTNLEKLRALQLDNLMAGHNAPTGVTHEAGDSFIDFMKTTLVTKNKNIRNDISH